MCDVVSVVMFCDVRAGGFDVMWSSQCDDDVLVMRKNSARLQAPGCFNLG